MSQTFQPRATEQGSQYRWLKGGLRLVGRASASWLLVWLAWAIGVLMLVTAQPLLAFVLMGISMMAFDLHVVAFDQVAASRPRLIAVIPQFFALVRKNARLYLNSFVLRLIVVALLVLFSSGIIWVLQHYELIGTSAQPQSEGMFGLSWGLWTYAWFLPSLFQRGGVISMRSWLIRRHGLSEQHAANLQSLALIRNAPQLLSFQRWITLPSLACVFLLPIMLPVLELFWVACMRCMYQDLFHGGMGIQEQKQEETAATGQAVVLPATR